MISGCARGSAASRGWLTGPTRMRTSNRTTARRNGSSAFLEMAEPIRTAGRDPDLIRCHRWIPTRWLRASIVRAERCRCTPFRHRRPSTRVPMAAARHVRTVMRAPASAARPERAGARRRRSSPAPNALDGASCGPTARCTISRSIPPGAPPDVCMSTAPDENGGSPRTSCA